MRWQSDKRLERELIAAMESYLSAKGLALVSCELAGGLGSWRLRVFLDKPGGITIDECAEASKALPLLFDESLLLGGCAIEVSSPGQGRRLRHLREARWAAGKRVRLSLVNGSPLSGTLISADESFIIIDQLKLRVSGIAYLKLEEEKNGQ